MPITACFSCFGLLGVLLLVLAAPASVVLLLRGEKRAALRILRVPVGMIVVPTLLTLLVFAAAERHSQIMSADPNRLFKVTFGFPLPPETAVLEAYHQSVMDYATTVMKFRTTQAVLDRIVANSFIHVDQEAFLRGYESNAHNLPENVRAWFLPAAQANRFYSAAVFERSFGNSEAVLCYEEKTQTVYFHWVGVD